MKHYVSITLALAIGLFPAATLRADVITQPPLSGNFAVTFSGYELITPSGSGALRLDIRGEGLLTADGNGNLTGNESFTAANAVIPEGSPVAATCTGALSGKVSEPGDGTAQIMLQFAPSTPAPTGVGPQDACVPTTTALSCVEIYAGPPFPLPVAVGEAQRRHRHRHRHNGGNNSGGAPNGSSGNGQPSTGSGGATAIAFPWFFGGGATSVKCVATGITPTLTPPIGTIDGASLSVSLSQTPPPSVTLPTPVPGPNPVPLPPGPPEPMSPVR